MNHPRVRLAPLAALALLALCAPRARADEDQRQFRKLTLDNGLRVLLASDPKVNASSASMAVGIGANADPRDAQGLAHFLEHMLFLSNKKYPVLNDYSKFLQSHGGSSNAYTAQDLTNYHFEVNNDGFPEALDRFAQFFISPSLDYEYAKREVMAVNSEHQKNTMDDTWRLMQLQRSSLRKDHPANAFSTGDAGTLKDAKEAVLRGFFNDYYKSKNMALAVLSDRSLDELERLVRERFAEVPAGEAKAWSAPADQLEEVKALRLFQVAPVKDLRQLQVFFDVPSQHQHALQRLGNMLGMTMGDEGQGSLLSYLKARGLATSLSAGLGGTRYYSSCSMTVGLTPQGLKQWREVLGLCFAYAKMLRTSGFPRHVWEEAKTLAELNDRYGAKPEGMQAAIDLANDIMEYGLAVADKANVTFQEPDPKLYQQLVDALVPENALVFLVAKGVQTDAKEPHYGTEYSYALEQGEPFDALGKVEVPKELHLPLPNPFVPKDTSLRAEQPVLLSQDEGVTLYYAQDTEFHRPKVALHLHVLSPAAYGSPRQAALTGLYAAMLQEQLNELAYPALMAGLGYSLQPTRKGLLLTVSGYSESAFKLLRIVGEAMRGPLDPEAFERVRLRAVEGIKNFPLGQAYQVVTELSRKLTLQGYVLPEEKMAALEGLKLEQLQAHVKELLGRTHIEALCCGNLTGAQARTAVGGLRAALGSQPFPPQAARPDAWLWLKPGEEVVLQRVGATDQACLRIDYQVGRSDVSTRMASELIARALGNVFYTEMRTKQKLGYIVFSGSLNRDDVQSLAFLIQSGTHAPEDLQARADACIAELPALFAQLPPAQFEAIRQSLIEDRKKSEKSIAEKAAVFWAGAFDKEGDFDWLSKEIAALEALDQAKVTALLKQVVEQKTRVVYLMAARQAPKFAKPGTVEGYDAFQAEHTYVTGKAGR
ncbi:MAG: insulinase family protein [Planctomycetota bacterium]